MLIKGFAKQKKIWRN